MSKTLSSFVPLANIERVWTAQTASLRCTAFSLQDGEICLYSPVSGLNSGALASLKRLGDVKYLLAPNHYHNKGLTEYKQAFPTAELVCSAAAQPRLQKQTGLEFNSLDAITQSLRPGMSLLEPKGLKTGEVWIDVAAGPQRAWVVTDAFRGAGKTNMDVSNRIELLGTFPKFGIGDLGHYVPWLAAQIAASPPNIIVGCHGAIAASPDIASQALSLMHALTKPA